MAKNPVFYVLTTLLLLSASLAVPSAHAADPNIPATTFDAGNLSGDWYFRLDCSGSNPDRVCELSQVEIPSPGPNDFQSWSDMKAVLDNSTNASSKVVLKSSLNLGGYDATNNKCKLNVLPLGNLHDGLDGDDKYIDGLCYL